MCGLAVLPFSTRPKDPGSCCLARIGVCAGSPSPALPLGRRRLAPNCGGADRQLRGLPDCLVDRCFDHPASGGIHGWGLRILRVLGVIGVGECVFVRTARLGEGCLCDRRSWHCNWWVDGRGSACGGFIPFRSRWVGCIHGGVADGRGCFVRSRNTGKARQRRCTEWRPRDASKRFGSQWGAAVGELAVRSPRLAAPARPPSRYPITPFPLSPVTPSLNHSITPLPRPDNLKTWKPDNHQFRARTLANPQAAGAQSSRNSTGSLVLTTVYETARNGACIPPPAWVVSRLAHACHRRWCPVPPLSKPTVNNPV